MYSSYTEKVCRSLIMNRGVKSMMFAPNLDQENMILQANAYLSFFKLVEKNDSVLFVFPENEDDEQSSSFNKFVVI